MARLLHFVHQETGKEYVVIVEDDDSSLEDYRERGYALLSEARVLDGVGRMPVNRPLWEHYSERRT